MFCGSGGCRRWVVNVVSGDDVGGRDSGGRWWCWVIEVGGVGNDGW